MIRAFLAVELDAALRRRIGETQRGLRASLDLDGTTGVRLSWPAIESMHLTIKFIGQMPEARSEPLCEALSAALAPHARITVPIERLGAFPRAAEPRVLWAGPPDGWHASDDAERLRALQLAVEHACGLVGIPADDRPFRPHLTLARVRSGERRVGRALAASGALDRPLHAGTLTIAGLALMKSDLRSGGAVHTRLWEVGLLS